MTGCTKNLYEIMGVRFNASFDEIKLAYKKLVRIYHPDINKSKDSEIKFKLLNNAYEILSDKTKRKNYDKLLNISGFDFKKDEIISCKIEKEIKKEKPLDIYPDNNSIIKEIKISEDEAKKGCLRTVNILNKQTCPKCAGKKTIGGIKCGFCMGEGEKKELKQIDIEIKKNIENQSFIYVGKINSSALYDKKLFLKITIESNQKLYFEDNNIIVHIEVPFFECILGARKEIAIKDLGLISFSIPENTDPLTRIKLEVKNNVKCNYWAEIRPVLPKNVTEEEKKLYIKLKELNQKL